MLVSHTEAMIGSLPPGQIAPMGTATLPCQQLQALLISLNNQAVEISIRDGFLEIKNLTDHTVFYAGSCLQPDD